jgi:hypothetical protein
MGKSTRSRSHLKLVVPAEDDRNPAEVWPGWADVNRAGLTLAVEMLEQVESSEEDEHKIRLADYACLEDWPREGRPFRNIVAEYLTAARNQGPEVEAGFCAVLSDIVGLIGLSTVSDSGRYRAVGELGGGEVVSV